MLLLSQLSEWKSFNTHHVLQSNIPQCLLFSNNGKVEKKLGMFSFNCVHTETHTTTCAHPWPTVLSNLMQTIISCQVHVIGGGPRQTLSRQS